MSNCANIRAVVEKMIVWHKALSTYIEDDMVYIEFKTGHPVMVGNWEVNDIVVQGGETYGVDKLE